MDLGENILLLSALCCRNISLIGSKLQIIFALPSFWPVRFSLNHPLKYISHNMRIRKCMFLLQIILTILETMNCVTYLSHYNSMGNMWNAFFFLRKSIAATATQKLCEKGLFKAPKKCFYLFRGYSTIYTLKYLYPEEKLFFKVAPIVAQPSRDLCR